MDEAIRRREREAAGGDPAAREAVLRERLRAGRLDPIRLRLAAALGDPAAGRLTEGVDAAPDDPVAWCQRIARHGRETAVRAAASAGAAALDPWRRCFPSWHGPQRALDAAEAWVLARSPAAAAEAHRCGSEAAHEAALAQEAGEEACYLRARAALCAAALAAQGSKRIPRRLVRDLAPLLGVEREAWAAAERELRLWAAGDDDPLQRRADSGLPPPTPPAER